MNSKWYTDQYGGKDKYTQVNVIVKDTDNIATIEDQIDEKINTNSKSPAVRITDATSQLETTAILKTRRRSFMAIGDSASLLQR